MTPITVKFNRFLVCPCGYRRSIAMAFREMEFEVNVLSSAITFNSRCPKCNRVTESQKDDVPHAKEQPCLSK